MAKTRAVHAYKEQPLELEARIIEAINKIGPRNVSEISRLTKAPVETIRYKIKKQFRNLGFRIHAEVDYAKLGLTLYWATLRFSKQYLAGAADILGILNSIDYLVYYGKIVPQGYYATLFALPNGAGEEYSGFLKFIQDLGVIEEFTFIESLYTKHHSMDPRHFNFQTGKWEMDWTKVELEPPQEQDERKSTDVAGVDKFDLLLVKELQIDALQHVVGIARKAKVHPKTLEYHYRAHVEGYSLISQYIVRWMNDVDRSLSHSFILARLVVNGLTKERVVRVRQVMHKLPFLWSEDILRDGTYVAWLWVPTEETTSTFDYIHKKLPELGDSMSLGFVKLWEACLYTVPHHMFSKEWPWDLKETKARFRKAISRLTKIEVEAT